jgi:predicted signal transduction protein with EAL and GGDEF domain
VAERLRDAVGVGIARLGGDEFAVVARGVADAAQAREVAGRVLAALGRRFEVDAYRLEIGASVGVALAPGDATTADGLLRCADVAMYSAKRGRSGYAMYSQGQDPYTAERLTLLSELSGSFRRNEMVLHYQPRVILAQKRLRGFEALVRWNHPRLGHLPPAQFIPLAEFSDVIRPLTLWILRAAMRQRRAWAELGQATRLAVNFSARHLMDDRCPEQIGEILEAEGAPAEALELEITESALIADPEHATATLERIRALGVHIAVDDFGTGYSSLSHLRRLPLNALKIDVSFVRNMLRSAQDRVIVESTVGLAHNLGLTVVAEGIEDEPTLAALRAMGCDEGQGYFIAPPMDAQAAGRWMQAGRLVH